MPMTAGGERELSISTKLSQRSTTKAPGLGKGLLICRSTIDAYGDRLWAEADAGRLIGFMFLQNRVSPRGRSGCTAEGDDRRWACK
jgi:K+-sensing histidine kinase KdpD